jgi:hypothetical protein
MANWKLSAKAIKEQIAKAKEATALADAVEPHAKKAYYDQSANRIVVELSNGADFRFVPSSVQELIAATPEQIAQVEISPSGKALRWKKLDADLSLPALMMGVFGTRMWMAQLGRIGGQATSEVKSAAARLNGIKGGRPKKVLDVDRVPARKTTGWKAKSVSTSPPRESKASRVLKSSHSTGKSVRSVAASALSQNAKTHSRSSKVSERSASKYTDKKRKK